MTKLSPLSVNIIYNKANTYGLNDDVQVIDYLLRHLQDVVGPINKARTADLREPLIHSDINIHLEIPIFSAISWAHTNVMLVNPEQWSYSYDAYAHAFDALVFRDLISASKFKEDFAKKGIPTDNIYVVPWTASWQAKDIKKTVKTGSSELGFVSFIAGSTSKYEYIKKILPAWKKSDPVLTIYTTRADFAEELKKMIVSVNSDSNITVKCEDLDLETRYRLMNLYRGHLVCSQGEAFGYAAANAEVAGAFTIMNSLPVFEETYGTSNSAVGWISNTYEVSDKVRYSIASPGPNLREELDKAFAMFYSANFSELYKVRQEVSGKRFLKTCTEFLPVLQQLYSAIKERRPKKGNYICPPVISAASCAIPITVITPTYNRKKLFEIAFHNLLLTDYPKDKIEWIVIEDDGKTEKTQGNIQNMVGESIMSFQVQVPEIKIKYIPIQGRMTIGEKRNIGVENASNDIILFMDDDDHYPETSFRRRVAWLTKGVKRGVGQANIACCTTLALYDLKRGISAVNVPPYDIPFAQRISEATLTFRKSAWLERKFPNVSLAEGEDWISGREDQVIEIPPQQIIVAFSHGANQSSRRIPPTDQKPSCFWHFPQEYLVFIHGLVGVEVVTKSK